MLIAPMEILFDLSSPLNRETTAGKYLLLTSSISKIIHGSPSATPSSRLVPDEFSREQFGKKSISVWN